MGQIEGLEIRPLKQIRDERGAVMHMMRADSPWFESFGEVYFSVVKEGVIKAWKKHLRMTQNLVVPVGRVKLVVFDDRPDSKTSGQLQEVVFGQNEYSLVSIPPGLWYGFQGISPDFALIANCTNIMFDETEVVRAELNQGPVDYKW